MPAFRFPSTVSGHWLTLYCLAPFYNPSPTLLQAQGAAQDTAVRFSFTACFFRCLLTVLNQSIFARVGHPVFAIFGLASYIRVQLSQIQFNIKANS